MATLRTRLAHRVAQRRISDCVDGNLLPAQRRRLERHADLCSECGSLRRAFMSLVVELRELRDSRDRSIVAGVIDRLRVADGMPAKRGR